MKTTIKGAASKKDDQQTLMRGERRRRPSHPGALLREIIVPASGLTQTELAARLGVSRRSVNMILNEQRPVTVDMAHRLARVFNNSPQFWLNLQQAVDMWDVLHAHQAEYEQIQPLEKSTLATGAAPV